MVFLSTSEPLIKNGLKYKIFVMIAIKDSEKIEIIENGANIWNQIPDLQSKDGQILLFPS